MTTVMWPLNMKPGEVMFHPNQVSRSGGRSVSGQEQVVVSSAGFWRAKLIFNTLQRERQAKRSNLHMTWRAMLAILEGRSNRVLIGPYDDANTPDKLSGISYAALTSFSDGTTFSDGSEFSQFGTPAEVGAAVSRGAMTLTANMIGSHVPQPGQYFGTYDRLYLIKRATLLPYNSPPSHPQYNLLFWPPLRADLPIGYTLNFDTPVCDMRFATDETGELAIRRHNSSQSTIDMVEVL